MGSMGRLFLIMGFGSQTARTAKRPSHRRSRAAMRTALPVVTSPGFSYKPPHDPNELLLYIEVTSGMKDYVEGIAAPS